MASKRSALRYVNLGPVSILNFNFENFKSELLKFQLKVKEIFSKLMLIASQFLLSIRQILKITFNLENAKRSKFEKALNLLKVKLTYNSRHILLHDHDFSRIFGLLIIILLIFC